MGNIYDIALVNKNIETQKKNRKVNKKNIFNPLTDTGRSSNILSVFNSVQH